ncbi:hypothetical protein V8E54_009802 [Elaphomyces granulatus]
MVAIMLEVFKLPSLAAAQLRFYQSVVEANDIYDFHTSVIKTNILDPSLWWPVIPQWRDNWLNQPKLAKAERSGSKSSRELCFAHWKPVVNASTSRESAKIALDPPPPMPQLPVSILLR